VYKYLISERITKYLPNSQLCLFFFPLTLFQLEQIVPIFTYNLSDAVDNWTETGRCNLFEELYQNALLKDQRFSKCFELLEIRKRASSESIKCIFAIKISIDFENCRFKYKTLNHTSQKTATCSLLFCFRQPPLRIQGKILFFFYVCFLNFKISILLVMFSKYKNKTKIKIERTLSEQQRRNLTCRSASPICT